jgi:hypothetical protein
LIQKGENEAQTSLTGIERQFNLVNAESFFHGTDCTCVCYYNAEKTSLFDYIAKIKAGDG